MNVVVQKWTDRETDCITGKRGRQLQYSATENIQWLKSTCESTRIDLLFYQDYICRSVLNHQGAGYNQVVHAFLNAPLCKIRLVGLKLSLISEGHRLMSLLPSQILLLPASENPLFSKKGCLSESARVSLLLGSYSSMLSIRSNS